MESNAIDRAVQALGFFLLYNAPPLEVRSIVQDVYDTAQDELTRDLCSVTTCARVWGVSPAVALRRITDEHARTGIAVPIDGVYYLRRGTMERLARTHARGGRHRKPEAE